LHCADARRFARATDQTYDVIVADLFHPGLDGAGALYTREHFAALRQRLAPGGLFCQWLPLHQLDAPTLQLVLRGFLDVFPEAQGWLLHFNVDIPVLGLLGSTDVLRWTHGWLEHRLTSEDALREQARAAGLGTTVHLLGCHLTGPAALREFAGAGPMNTEDRPLVMFRAPRHTGRRAARPEMLLIELLTRCRAQPGDVLASDSLAAAPAFATNLTAFVEARDLYLRGLVIEGEGRVQAAFEIYLQAAGRSLHFTPAYARCVTIIQAMAQADRATARQWFQRLEAAQPGQPLGRQVLGPLFDGPEPP
jgi:spermidine synthase